jgi:cell volume regulation protein A
MQLHSQYRKSALSEVNLTILLIGALLSLSIVSTLVSARLGAPLLLVFLFVGMLAGEDGFGIQFSDPSMALLVGSIALVIILFDGGMRTHTDRFKIVLAPASSLATLGVVITCAGIGLVAGWLFHLSLVESLLLGAILSSTDAAAVFAIFQSAGLHIKDRVASTLEIESGSNDPMAVMLTLTLVALVSGDANLGWSTLVLFLQQACFGITAGYLAGRGFIWLCRKLPLATAFFPLLAISSAIFIYAATNQINGSGFLAVYLMGIIVGNSKLSQVQPILRLQDGLAWLSQLVLFLMLGLLVSPSKLVEVALPALLLALAMIFVIRPLAVAISLAPFGFPMRDQLFISWVGLRGAVPIVLALIPWLAGVPEQSMYFNVAFFVVLVSLLLQGWSIAPVARWLKLEVPLQYGPSHQMILEGLPAQEVVQISSFRLNADSAMVGVDEQQLLPHVDAQYLGVVRHGQWIKSSDAGLFQVDDLVLLLSKTADIGVISEKISAGATTVALDTFAFFGEFVLDSHVTLQELAAFYVFDLTGLDANQRLIDLFAQRFHGRVVVGDKITIENVEMTVKQVTPEGSICQVGVKQHTTV